MPAVPDILVAPYSADDIRRAVAEWSEYSRQPAEIENRIGLKLRLIPPGRYQQGYSEEEWDRLISEKSLKRKIQHEVTLTRPWYCGVFHVSQKEFERVSGYNPSPFRPPMFDKPPTPIDPAHYPALNVTWFDAILFCIQLSEMDGLSPAYSIEDYYHWNEFSGDPKRHIMAGQVKILSGDGYRLPTEAEWEFIAKAGTDGIYPDIEQRVKEREKKTYRVQTPLGTKPPNAFGVSELDGFHHEWCADCMKLDYSRWLPSAIDPLELEEDQDEPGRIIRGATEDHVMWRSYDHPGNVNDGTSFRVCRTISIPE